MPCRLQHCHPRPCCLQLPHGCEREDRVRATLVPWHALYSSFICHAYTSWLPCHAVISSICSLTMQSQVHQHCRSGSQPPHAPIFSLRQWPTPRRLQCSRIMCHAGHSTVPPGHAVYKSLTRHPIYSIVDCHSINSPVVQTHHHSLPPPCSLHHHPLSSCHRQHHHPLPPPCRQLDTMACRIGSRLSAWHTHPHTCPCRRLQPQHPLPRLQSTTRRRAGTENALSPGLGTCSPAGAGDCRHSTPCPILQFTTQCPAGSENAFRPGTRILAPAPAGDCSRSTPCPVLHSTSRCPAGSENASSPGPGTCSPAPAGDCSHSTRCLIMQSKVDSWLSHLLTCWCGRLQPHRRHVLLQRRHQGPADHCTSRT